jgi:dolichyl-diphosphooligosaccharide--protein glycosyltransferase
MTNPGMVVYTEYAEPKITKVSLPVLTAAQEMNSSQAKLLADQYNRNAQDGYHAAVLSPSVVAPIETVPAFRHYRLVHESPTNVFNSDSINVKYVKTFEYVKGAHIKGEGIIEVPVVTNTGRSYTYRQESINGEFIVPYSTSGNPYDVKTVGNYQIAGTNQQFEVPESAVIQGLAIQ